MKETLELIATIGVKRTYEQVSRGARIARARRDAGRVIERFAREHEDSIWVVRNLWDEVLQDQVMRELDIVRQRFMALHEGLDPCWLTDLWFSRAENHEEVSWALKDLEYEQDRAAGRSLAWDRGRTRVEPITGPQLSLLGDALGDRKG